jgi:tetratricopeptide (TPR) repeat protein
MILLKNKGLHIILLITVFVSVSRCINSDKEVAIINLVTFLIERGEESKAKGDFESAKASYQIAIFETEKSDDDKLKKKTLSFLYFNIGFCEMELEDYNAALVSFDQSINLKPLAECYAARGNTRFYLDNRIMACEDCSKAIDLGFEVNQELFNKICNQL